MQLLAVQVADEARHVEVFTRRALLGGDGPARHLRRGGTGVAGHPRGRARLLVGVFPPVGAGRGELPQPPRLPRAPRPRPRHPAGVPPGPAGRGPPRRLRPGPPRAPGRGRPVAAGPATGGGGASPRRPGRHRRPQRGGLRRPGGAGRRFVGRPPPWPRATAGCSGCRRTWTRAASAAWCASGSRRPRRPPCPPSTPATSCSRTDSAGCDDRARPGAPNVVSAGDPDCDDHGVRRTEVSRCAEPVGELGAPD